LPKKTFEEAASAGVHLIAQVKDNQPTLHATVADLCATAKPREKTRTVDKNKRLRHETRSYEIFLPRKALAGSEWNEHVACIIRVQRDTLKRSAATGLWIDTHETAYYVCDIVPSAKEAARAIREHWGIENRAHYIRDCSFAEDASRIRKNPGVFARIRSFAANILRLNRTTNVANTRYRLAIGGIPALQSIKFM
jgi:predicted transposase YbfD/YdcC